MGDEDKQPAGGTPVTTEAQLKFEEYKLIVENTQKMSERRQSSTRTYLTVNTAIFVVLGFLTKEGRLEGWLLLLALAPLFFGGFIACYTWKRIIDRFEIFIGWRYKQINLMEDDLKGSFRLFNKEWKELFHDDKFSFSKLEVRLPTLFMFLYGIYAIGLVAMFVFGWNVTDLVDCAIRLV